MSVNVWTILAYRQECDVSSVGLMMRYVVALVEAWWWDVESGVGEAWRCLELGCMSSRVCGVCGAEQLGFAWWSACVVRLLKFLCQIAYLIGNVYGLLFEHLHWGPTLLLVLRLLLVSVASFMPTLWTNSLMVLVRNIFDTRGVLEVVLFMAWTF